MENPQPEKAKGLSRFRNILNSYEEEPKKSPVDQRPPLERLPRTKHDPATSSKYAFQLQKQLARKPNWWPFGIGGLLIVPLAILIFGGIYLYLNVFAVPSPTDVPEALGIGSTMILEKDGMTLLYVPAGEFKMGFGNDAHTVYLDAYWIDQTEVTNAMYAICASTCSCRPPSKTKSNTRDNYYGDVDFYDYPVIYVSWNDALAYCEWAERRLPTEAEWEKAAGWDEGSKAQRLYPWENEIDGTYANYDQNVGATTPVGSYDKGASFYGAYDMAGNVREWVSSLYQSYPYNASDGREDLSTSGNRVLHGGSWNYFATLLRSTIRRGVDPMLTYNDLGFRCSRSSP